MTAVLTETVTVTRVVAGSWDVRDALTATHVSTGNAYDTPEVLKSVRIVKAGSELSFTSTDRWRLTVATLTLEADDNASDAPDWDALIHRDDVKRLIAALPKRATRGVAMPISLTLTGRMLTLDTGESTVSVSVQDGEFPKLASIIVSTTSPTESIAFNPGFMVDLCKMPGRERNVPVRLSLDGTTRPLRSGWQAGAVSYWHVIMPVRVS